MEISLQSSYSNEDTIDFMLSEKRNRKVVNSKVRMLSIEANELISDTDNKFRI